MNRTKAANRKNSIRNVAVDRMYEQTLAEAPQSAENVAFFAKTCGAGPVADLAFNEEGLAEVETIYRELCSHDLFTADLDRRMFEKLMTYFLGETLIRCQRGEWYAYKGRYYTIKPVLIRFSDLGKALDVSIFCTDLYDSDVVGARQGRALVTFYKKARSIALIPASSSN